MVASWDAVIVGGGHNGLTCAGYLARRGLRVAVVEARYIVGGAAVTEEFYPGFRNSICSYSVGLLHPKIITDLELERYGLQIVLRNSAGFAPLPNGDSLYLPRDTLGKLAELERLHPGDGAAYESFNAGLEAVTPVLRQLMLQTPPNIGGGLADFWKALLASHRLHQLPVRHREALLRLMTASAGDYLDEHFGGEAIKGLYGYNAVVGNFQSPYSAGSAYVLLHHNFGEVNGVAAAWGHPLGGMGAITQAMARSAAAHGAEIRTSAPVSEVLVERGKTRGVRLVDGETLSARVVVAGCNPRLLTERLLDPAVVPDSFRDAMHRYRCRSATLRMNLALSELPDYACRPGTECQDHHRASLIVSPSLRYLEDAYDDAKHGGWSQRPVIEMNINSTIDNSLAPAGAHVASVFCQHFHPQLSDDRDWDQQREAAAETVISTLDDLAPNFRRSLIGYQILTPKDLETEYGLLGGDIFHGQLHLDQLYSLRPSGGFADYRLPVVGLYLCGSGAHPGGGVSGIPGHNAAREILKDFGR